MISYFLCLSDQAQYGKKLYSTATSNGHDDYTYSCTQRQDLSIKLDRLPEEGQKIEIWGAR